jgi:2-alkenal reductase
MTLTVLRDGNETQVAVTLEARPATSTAQSETAQQDNQQNDQQGNQNTRPNSSGVWLGILGQTLTTDIAQAMNLDANQAGVLVQQVQPNSPASEAGLMSSEKQVDVNGQQMTVGGDVITAVDGQNVSAIEELIAALQQYKAGDKVTLTILRDGSEQEVGVTLAARPAGN